MLALIHSKPSIKHLMKLMFSVATTLVFNLLLLGTANAHLMTAQHGTLNVLDDGIFMVISLPVSAINGIDENNDGKVSLTEFSNGRFAISEKLHKNLSLSDSNSTYPLKGLLLSPAKSHNVKDDTINQVVVMGKFMIKDKREKDSTGDLLFQLNMFGEQKTEQSLKITLIRKRDQLKKTFTLTPTNYREVLL